MLLQVPLPHFRHLPHFNLGSDPPVLSWLFQSPRHEFSVHISHGRFGVEAEDGGKDDAGAIRVLRSEDRTMTG
jgi:hypothetical protein